MPRSWRDYAAANPPADGCDNSDKRDNRADPAPLEGAFVPNVPNVTALPADVRSGLVWLSTAPAPGVLGAELWPEIVRDAQGIASNGWAVQALGLGWTPLDLWGAVTNADGDPSADGLAVKLEGRRVLALCGSFATVANASGGRTYLYRGSNEGARLLWALDRAA